MTPRPTATWATWATAAGPWHLTAAPGPREGWTADISVDISVDEYSRYSHENMVLIIIGTLLEHV